MNLIELGAMLRRERESKGMSVADAMSATKISRRIIDAFEMGDSDHFPHEVYAKGFIKNYARVLGLDPEECVRIIDREYVQAGEEEEILDPMAPLTMDQIAPDQEGKPRRSVWVLPAIFGLILLLGGLIWYVSGQDNSASTAASAEVVVEEPVAAQEVEAPAVEIETVEAEQEREALSGGAGSSSSPVLAEGEHVLMVKVGDAEGSWIGVWNEDEPDMESDFTLLSGQSKELKFFGTKRIRFGKVQDVEIFFDGQVVDMGNSTGIRNLTFP